MKDEGKAIKPMKHSFHPSSFRSGDSLLDCCLASLHLLDLKLKFYDVPFQKKLCVAVQAYAPVEILLGLFVIPAMNPGQPPLGIIERIVRVNRDAAIEIHKSAFQLAFDQERPPAFEVG